MIVLCSLSVKKMLKRLVVLVVLAALAVVLSRKIREY